MRNKLLLLFVILSLVLSACSGATPTPTAPPPAVAEPTPSGDETTVLFAAEEVLMASYRDLINAFEKDNPGIKVKAISINEILGLGMLDTKWPDDAQQRLAAGADVISLSPGYRDMSAKGLIRDLTPFIAADASFNAGDFFPGALQQYQWDGGTWGVPNSVEFQFIVFDKNAFDTSGVKYPEPGWTWDDFTAKAKATTQRDGDKVMKWGFVQQVPAHNLFIASRVKSLLDTSTDPATPRFDQPDVRDAVRWYTDLYLNDKVTPYFEMPEEVTVANLPEGYKLVQGNQAAAWVDSGLSWQIYKQQKPQLGIVPFPVSDDLPQTSPLYAQGVMMSSGTTKPEAAWRWMSYLSQQAPKGIATFKQLPARRSVLESSGLLDKIDPEYAAAVRFVLDHVAQRDTSPALSALSDAVETILKDGKSIDDALADAQTKGKEKIAEDAQQKADATPVPTVVVAAPQATAVNQTVTTVRFSLGTALFNAPAYRDLAKRFSEANPGIAVEIKTPDVTNAALDIPIVAKDVDCFMWTPSLQDPKNLEAILNLEPFIDADPTFNKADFYPATLDQFTAQGQLWGLPAEVTPYVIEYNKDLFDAANVPYPKADWTLDDFLATAKALTKGEGDTKQYGFVGDYYESNDLIMMLQALGAEPLDTKQNPPKVKFDDATMRQAMQWYVDLHTKHGVKPVFVTDFSELLSQATTALVERETMINSGRAAMWTAYAGQPDLLGDGKRAQLNRGVVPLPIGPAGSKAGSYITSYGYYISADGAAKQACWKWINFLTEQADVRQGLPARKAVAESEAYRQQVGAERAAAYQASLGSGGVSSVYQFLNGEDSWLSYSLLWLTKAYGQAVEGKAPVEKALADAQQMADDYRACVVQNDGQSDTQQQRKCVKQADSSIPDFLLGLNE